MLDIGHRHSNFPFLLAVPNSLDVEISIEHLSLNFDKLENMHYGTNKFFSQSL